MEKALIIGGGVAGLTAGIFLRKNGVACEVLERNRTVGGNLTGWRRGDYVIDNCLHWLTGSRKGTALYDLWQEIGMLGEDTGLYRAPYFYKSEVGGRSAALYASVAQTRRALHLLSPADAREIDRLLDAVEALRDAECRIGSSSLRYASALPRVLRYGCLSLSELAEKFESPVIRALLTDYIGGEFMALGLLSAYASFTCGNASLPLGGSPAAAERIAETFVSLGGILRTGCEVTRIVTNGREATGILTSDGHFHRGNAVFCACDPYLTFGHLLPDVKMPRVLKEKHSLRFSAMHAAFACDTDMIPRFDTLVIDAPVLTPGGAGRLVLREFSHEPAFAPAGKRVLQCMVLQNEEECRKWILLSRRPEDYRRRKEILAGRMARAIVTRFPSVTDSLRLLDFWTPATYRRYHGAPCGSFMSFYLPPRRLPVSLPHTVAPYRNVYLATQWCRSPGGVPGAAIAGKEAAEEALKKAAEKNAGIFGTKAI